MKNILIGVLTLVLFSCDNRLNGKEIEEGISICKKITQYNNGNCEYLFVSKWDIIRIPSKCGKWQIGDTL